MKWRVPYSVMVNGELEVEAANDVQAHLLARRYLRSTKGKDQHKLLLEQGMGAIRLHADAIAPVEEEPNDAPQWDGQRFKDKEEDDSQAV